jgi:hypothetical protein
LPPLRRQERIERGEIIGAAAPIDQRPSHALPRDRDADPRQHRIILVRVDVMAELDGEVPPPPILPVEGRTFEAGHEEGRKNAVAPRHDGPTRQARCGSIWSG